MGGSYACPVCGREPFSVGRFDPCECRLAARLAEIAAEEAAGLRRFEVDEWPIRSDGLEAMYTEFNRPASLAVRPGLPGEARRARELEARGYYLWTPRLLKRYTGRVVGKMAENRAFMYRAERPEDVPYYAVRAIGCVIEEMEPGWVEEVAEARRHANGPRAIATRRGLPIQAVLAGLRVLDARQGEDAPGSRGAPSRVRKAGRPRKGEGVEVPRETGTLEGFESWDRRLRAPTHQQDRVAFVSFWADGTISISKAAHEMFGSPGTVQLLFDPKLRRVGMKPVERDAGRAAYSSYYFLDQGQKLIPARRFCEHYGIPLTETRRYTPRLVDGALVVDL